LRSQAARRLMPIRYDEKGAGLNGTAADLRTAHSAESPLSPATEAGTGRAMASAVPVLWQFRQSHYNEKARWALDWKRIRHERRSLLPGLHVPRVMWMTLQKSVPVLVLDGRAIADSTRIIAAVEALRPEPPLYPAAPAERRRALELEEFF